MTHVRVRKEKYGKKKPKRTVEIREKKTKKKRKERNKENGVQKQDVDFKKIEDMVSILSCSFPFFFCLLFI